MKKPIVIFDTDMDTDCDDAAALLMLIRAHSAGKIILKGVVADSVCAHAASFCHAITSHYGLDIPIGRVDPALGSLSRFCDYVAHQKRCEGVAYNKMLPTPRADYWDAAELYRTLLLDAEDGSITVLCVGMLTAVSMAICADAELFRRKVARVVVMGNPYRENDFNFAMDAEATERFFATCPSPVFVSYAGRGIITGQPLMQILPEDHPVRRAYEIWTGGKGRDSWDLIAALYAMDPDSSVFREREQGRIVYDCNTKNAQIMPGTRDRIIEPTLTDEQMAELLNTMLAE